MQGKKEEDFVTQSTIKGDKKLEAAIQTNKAGSWREDFTSRLITHLRFWRQEGPILNLILLQIYTKKCFFDKNIAVLDL